MIVPILYGFLTSWLVEAEFYAANDVLTKKVNLLQTEKKRRLTPEAESRLGRST